MIELRWFEYEYTHGEVNGIKTASIMTKLQYRNTNHVYGCIQPKDVEHLWIDVPTERINK